MKTTLRNFFFALLVLLAGNTLFGTAGWAEEGGPYYTRVNIWYEKPEKILSTNYHKGAIIPVGTEVEILKTGDKISFVEKSTGSKFKLVLVDKYTDLSKQEFFDRYFSKENILQSKEFTAFSDMEKKNIEDGQIDEGMSKEATLIAYGYPPSHRTPSTNSNTWTYWESRLITSMVQFKDNKIADIIR